MADNYLFDGLLADKLATPDGRNALFATLPKDGRRYTYGDVEDVSGRFANVLVGLLSALVDNIPVMFAVLSMDPLMSQGQWLLVTLTAGVGGSLLAVGSAAGVALLGQARGYYSVFSHLRWTPAIALGLAASIAAHFWINAAAFAAGA